MALVTRCTHAGCGTLFRVNVAQLQAHGGQVRCGQCGQVFDAFPMLTTVPDTALRPPRAEMAPAPTARAAPSPAPAIDLSMADATALDAGGDATPATASTVGDGAEVTLPLGTARASMDLGVERRRPGDHDPNRVPVDGSPDRPVDVPDDPSRSAAVHADPAEPGAPPPAPAIGAAKTVRSAPREPEPASAAPVAPIVPEPGFGLPDGPRDELPGPVPGSPATGQPFAAPSAPAAAMPAAMDSSAPAPAIDGAQVAGPEARAVESGVPPRPQPVPASAASATAAPSERDVAPAASALMPDPVSTGRGTDTPASGLGDTAGTAAASAERASGLPMRAVLLAAAMLLGALLAAWMFADRLPGPLADGLPSQPPLAVTLALAAVLVGLLLRRVHRHAATWWLVAALLSATLALQAAVAWRAEIASRNPALRPLLEAICRAAGCRVGLPRESRDLSIESSDLLALDAARPQLIQLVGTIRNRGDRRVALPAIELTLTDGQERPVARRVLLPVQYMALGADPESGVRAGEEFSIRLTLDTTDLRPVGYRLYLFHP